jgi:hypothetical protein
VKQLIDDDGDVIVNPAEEMRFKEARAGDHLMTPFQCQLCHFRKFMGRNPIMTFDLDCFILEYIVIANLNALWCRASCVNGESKLAGRGTDGANIGHIRHAFHHAADGPLSIV